MIDRTTVLALLVVVALVALAVYGLTGPDGWDSDASLG